MDYRNRWVHVTLDRTGFYLSGFTRDVTGSFSAGVSVGFTPSSLRSFVAASVVSRVFAVRWDPATADFCRVDVNNMDQSAARFSNRDC
mmetsp:Transcript_18193/g.43833  ORF Transcript_18193/g.43833 Transcript_18193/m.43833 type:complete len:88 (+) Transcript_18193:256-519(+)